MLIGIFKRVKRMPRKAAKLFGGPPREYWAGILIFFLLFFVGILLFDFYLYTSAQSRISEAFTVSSDLEIHQVNKTVLIETLDALSLKLSSFKKTLGEPLESDPSL